MPSDLQKLDDFERCFDHRNKLIIIDKVGVSQLSQILRRQIDKNRQGWSGQRHATVTYGIKKCGQWRYSMRLIRLEQVDNK